MGRKPKFTDEQFLDAACALVARKGPAAVTMAAVAGSLCAPIGSLYHRFSSKEELLAGLWLRTAEQFQEGFMVTLRDEGGLRAALYTPRWVRDNLEQARLLLMHRREEFMSPGWNDETRDRAVRLAKELDSGLRSFARGALGSASRSNLRRVTFVLIDVPYAAVRSHLLKSEPPPEIVDRMVQDTYFAIMGSKQ